MSEINTIDNESDADYKQASMVMERYAAFRYKQATSEDASALGVPAVIPIAITAIGLINSALNLSAAFRTKQSCLTVKFNNITRYDVVIKNAQSEGPNSIGNLIKASDVVEVPLIDGVVEINSRKNIVLCFFNGDDYNQFVDVTFEFVVKDGGFYLERITANGESKQNPSPPSVINNTANCKTWFGDFYLTFSANLKKKIAFASSASGFAVGSWVEIASTLDFLFFEYELEDHTPPPPGPTSPPPYRDTTVFYGSEKSRYGFVR